MSLILAFSMTQLEVNRDQEACAFDDNGKRVFYIEAFDNASGAKQAYLERFPDAKFTEVSELNEVTDNKGYVGYQPESEYCVCASFAHIGH